MANMLTLAAYERARRALRGACELHCANAQMGFASDTLAKEKEVTARATSFSFLVEVWRFELQASSTRIEIYSFF